MANLTRQPVEASSINEMIEFSLSYPVKPHHSKKQMERFLRSFVSSETLVFDLHNDRGRLACAVLLDKIQNPSNSACLEILGLKTDGDASEAIELLLRSATSQLPQDKEGIEFVFHDDLPVSQDMLVNYGFKPYYSMFDMEAAHPPEAPTALPRGYRVDKLTLAKLPEYHQVLCKAFERNLETSIPSLDEMKLNFGKADIPTKLLLHDDRICGFYSVSVGVLGAGSGGESNGPAGEVNTIGLHPTYRKKGLGALLLTHAMTELYDQGAREFKLTVAAENAEALGLYKGFGFKIVSESPCLRYLAVKTN